MYEKTKEHFISTVKNSGPKYDYLLRHLPLVERWAKKLLLMFPDADQEVVLLGVWLHDIGRVVGDKDTDHAINSEAEAKRYLSELKVSNEIIEKVAHCARAHRCKDVLPSTLEAKIIAAADSASHMTDTVYIDISNRGDLAAAQQKLERDFIDVGGFSNLQGHLKPLYEAWKKLLQTYPKEI